MFGFYMDCYSVAEPNEAFVWHFMKLPTYDWFIQFEPESLWGDPWWEIETDINQDEVYFNGLVPAFEEWTVFDEFAPNTAIYYQMAEDDQSDASTVAEDEAHPDNLSDYDNDSNYDELDDDMLFYGD